jgi:hypothetical protein
MNCASSALNDRDRLQANQGVPEIARMALNILVLVPCAERSLGDYKGQKLLACMAEQQELLPFLYSVSLHYQ